MNLVGPLDAEKFAEAGCLYVFIIGFPASLFKKIRKLALLGLENTVAI